MDQDICRKFLSLSEEDQDSVIQFMDFLISLESLENDNLSRKKYDVP